MSSEVRDIRLPAELCNDAERCFAARFASVEDLLVFVLQELLRDQALHTFDAKDLTVGSKVFEIGDITVQQDGVKVQLK